MKSYVKVFPVSFPGKKIVMQDQNNIRNFRVLLFYDH
jgi:hypothetical protein